MRVKTKADKLGKIRRRECIPPVMESLEDRQLLSGGAVLSDGVLTIRGTGAADTINFGVGKSSSRYLATVNGESYSFRHLDVGSIKILGVAGNDHITVQRFGLKDPVTAVGGPGRDTVRGVADGQTYVPPPVFETTFSFGEPRLDGVLVYA